MIPPPKLLRLGGSVAFIIDNHQFPIFLKRTVYRSLQYYCMIGQRKVLTAFWSCLGSRNLHGKAVLPNQIRRSQHPLCNLTLKKLSNLFAVDCLRLLFCQEPLRLQTLQLCLGIFRRRRIIGKLQKTVESRAAPPGSALWNTKRRDGTANFLQDEPLPLFSSRPKPLPWPESPQSFIRIAILPLAFAAFAGEKDLLQPALLPGFPGLDPPQEGVKSEYPKGCILCAG